MPGLDRGQNIYVYPSEEQHITDPKFSQILSHYPYSVIPETQKINVNHFESRFNSVSATQGRNNVVYNHSGHKTVASPDGKKMHQGSSDSVFSTGAVQFSPRMYRARTQSTGRFSPAQVDNAAVGFNTHSSIQAVKSSVKSESHKIDATPTRHHIQSLQPQESHLTTRPLLHNSFKAINKNTDSTIKGHSAGKGGTQMSYPTWSPRVYSSDVMSEARGYAHVRRLRPSFDKTGPQASSAAGKKFSGTGFSSGMLFIHDSRKLGFGPGVSSSERQQNLKHNSRGSQPSSRHPPPQHKTQTLVKGKFKAFQRLPPTDDEDVPAGTRPSDASTQEAAGTTPSPSLNSTGTTTVTGEMSTKSASPIDTEGPDAPLLPQASILEGQSESSAEVGPSLEQNKTDSPSKLQLAEDRKGDTVVTSPLQTDQSSTDLSNKT